MTDIIVSKKHPLEARIRKRNDTYSPDELTTYELINFITAIYSNAWTFELPKYFLEVFDDSFTNRINLCDNEFIKRLEKMQIKDLDKETLEYLIQLRDNLDSKTRAEKKVFEQLDESEQERIKKYHNSFKFFTKANNFLELINQKTSEDT